MKRTKGLVAALAALSVSGLVIVAAYASSTPSWSMSGQGITNWRYQPDEHKLTAGNVKSQLGQRWVATLGGDVSATAAVVDGRVYVPDWSGKFTALDAATGAVVWQDNVGSLVGRPGAISRTSPAVSGDSVVFGTQGGAYLVSLNKNTGALLWKVPLDSHPLAIDSASPTIYDGTVYVGVASVEENGVDCGASLNACYFRGSADAIDLATGALKWKTYTISAAQAAAGYSGAAVWGSSPAIDVKRHSVYITTGNDYSAPPSVKACATAAGSDLAALAACEPQNNGNYVDAIMSLDLSDGHIKWANKMQGYDAWTTACIGFPTACPTPAGPDFDFGQGAMLIPTKAGDVVRRACALLPRSSEPAGSDVVRARREERDAAVAVRRRRFRERRRRDRGRKCLLGHGVLEPRPRRSGRQAVRVRKMTCEGAGAPCPGSLAYASLGSATRDERTQRADGCLARSGDRGRLQVRVARRGREPLRLAVRRAVLRGRRTAPPGRLRRVPAGDGAPVGVRAFRVRLVARRVPAVRDPRGGRDGRGRGARRARARRRPAPAGDPSRCSPGPPLPRSDEP